MEAEVYNPEFYTPRRSNIYSSQAIIVTIFQMPYGDEHDLACPTGRVSISKNPVLLLSRDTKREDVYKDYKLRWKPIMDFRNQ